MVKVAVLSIGLMIALPCCAQESSSQQTLALAMNAQETSVPASTGSSAHAQTSRAQTHDTSQQTSDQEGDAGGGVLGVYGGGGKVGEGGVYTGMFLPGTMPHQNGFGLMAELGVAAKTPANTADGVFALNYQQIFVTDRHPGNLEKHHAFVFLNGGYTRFFLTGNAADYGGGVVWRLPGTAAMFKQARFEYREFYIAGYGRQPEVRVSWELGGPWE